MAGRSTWWNGPTTRPALILGKLIWSRQLPRCRQRWQLAILWGSDMLCCYCSVAVHPYTISAHRPLKTARCGLACWDFVSAFAWEAGEAETHCGPLTKERKMTVPVNQMLFTLPSNASLSLYPDNTTTEYRVELPSRVSLQSADYEVALASFYYPRTWFNVTQDEQYWVRYSTATPEGHARHLEMGDEPPDSSDPEVDSESSGLIPRVGFDTFAPARTRPPCPGLARRRQLIPGHYESVEAILEQINDNKTAAVFTYSQPRERITVTFLASSRDCGYKVQLSPALSLLLGWPNEETTLLGRRNHHIEAPGAVRLDVIDMLYVHCDLASDYHVVGDVKNCLLRVVPVQGRHGDLVAYEPRILDWLPVRWTEFKSVHLLITDHYGRRIPFERGTCAVKLLVRRRRLLMPWNDNHHTLCWSEISKRPWFGKYFPNTVSNCYSAAQRSCCPGRYWSGRWCDKGEKHDTGTEESRGTIHWGRHENCGGRKKP